MATLKLNKKPAAKKAAPGEERRAPLRGKGVSRPRETLAEAQTRRQEHSAERQRPEDAPRASAPSKRAAPARSAPTGGGFRREEPARGGQRGDQRFDQRQEQRPEQRSARPARPARDEPRQAPSDRSDEQRPAFRQDQRRATGPMAEQTRRPRPPVEPNAEGERLSKRMGELGMASRREADEWIGAGWVRVDGKMAVLGQRVGPDVVIQIDPAAHKEQAKQVTILLHKPMGYVSGQAEDGYEPAVVLVKSGAHWSDDASGQKFHIGHARNLAPAGRLDIDSTGLLVLTQDGRIAKTLIGEDSDIEKEYLVRVEHIGHDGAAPMNSFPAHELERLQHGLELDGVQLKPAKVSWANEDQLRFCLREGRKRQIRRMCEQVGLKVVGLKRVRIGRVVLGKLPVGEWRYLAPWERF